MCAFYRPTIYKESLYASPSEKELMMNKKKSQQEELRQSYVRQMEEIKQRKKLEKLLDKADDLIYLQTEKDYSPWGRGGGGAPLRDNMGDVISDLNAVYIGERSPVNEPLSAKRKNIIQRFIKLLKRAQKRAQKLLGRVHYASQLGSQINGNKHVTFRLRLGPEIRSFISLCILWRCNVTLSYPFSGGVISNGFIGLP